MPRAATSLVIVPVAAHTSSLSLPLYLYFSYFLVAAFLTCRREMDLQNIRKKSAVLLSMQCRIRDGETLQREDEQLIGSKVEWNSLLWGEFKFTVAPN